MTALYNEFGRGLAAAGFVTQGFLSPGRCRRTGHAVTAAITTTVRVVGGRHDYAANGRPDTHVAFAASLTNLYVLVLLVTDGTNGSHGVNTYQAHLAAGQSHLGVFFLFGNQLGAGAGSAGQLGAFARLEFNSVDNRTRRDILKRQAVTIFYGNFLTNADLTADAHALGG
jgi:hypothetical protein